MSLVYPCTTLLLLLYCLAAQFSQTYCLGRVFDLELNFSDYYSSFFTGHIFFLSPNLSTASKYLTSINQSV